MLFKNNKQKKNEVHKGGQIMCMHANRYDYTTSPIWPIVPFRLTQMTEEEQKELGIEYSIGMDSGIVKGWSMMIAEEIGHAVLIYDKPFLSRGLAELETDRFYDELSPVCSVLRKCSDKCLERCRKQDKKIVLELFDKLDAVYNEGNSDQQVEDIKIIIEPSENPIHIHVKYEDTEQIFYHFEYTCPTTGMTELAFPVFCEDFLIAMVIAGQIIEDVKDVERCVDTFCKKEEEGIEKRIRDVPSFDWNVIAEKEKEKSDIISKIRESIIKLERLYQNQVDGERRRILNDVLNELTEKLNEREDIINPSMDVAFDDKQVMFKKLKRSINNLKDKMGIENINLYWDNNLTAEPKIDGKFYIEWCSKKKPGDSEWIQHPQDTENGVGDLFKVDEGRIETNRIPNDDTWSVFIYWPTDDSVAPIIFGIKYADKRKYLYSEFKELYWEKYILPKYAVFIQSLAASRIARIRADVLSENRTMQEHEMGQINTAVQILGTRFEKYINTTLNTLRMQYKGSEYYSKLEFMFSDFVHRSNLYRQDMEGQFHLIYIMSQIYDELEVNAKSFDVYTEFLNKWRFCFNARCNEKYNSINVQTYSLKNQIRKMYTDSQMLEYAIYNIVNNAIKYSYINTQVSVDLKKSDDDNYHIFTVTDYGLYLDKNDQTIFEKGVKKASGYELLTVQKNEESSEGKTEGKGFGLYWCKRLANALGCEIVHDNKEISKYYVPLLKPFLSRYKESKPFRDFWNAEMKKSSNGEMMSHDSIKHEYNHLLYETKEYSQIVVDCDETFGNRIGEYVIFDEINKPTNCVTFMIKVPKYTTEGVK